LRRIVVKLAVIYFIFGQGVTGSSKYTVSEFD